MKSIRALAGGVAFACAFAVHATDNGQATWESISAKAAQAEASPVTIKTNYFLGWTGAWDTVIMKETKLWEKWLPKGSKVEWKRNLQGPPVITDLVANKQNVGYLGDNPAIISTTRRQLAPIDIVGVNTMSPGRMCGLLMVRSDAPEFKSSKEAIKWLDGKKVAVPKGSCADRIAQHMFEVENVNVQWQQMQGEVIVTSLQAKRIDGALIYEPHLSKAIFDGHGRFAASAAVYGEEDANAILMRQDFVKENRAAAIAWLKANIEALYFIRDKPVEAVNIVKKELPEYTRENLWYAIYGKPPAETGADPIGLYAEMALTDRATALLNRGLSFLHDLKIVRSKEFHKEALRSDLINQAFKDLGLDPSKGLYELKTSAENPFKGDELVAAAK